MINIKKLGLFVVITFMFVIALYINCNLINGTGTLNNIILSVMYAVLILIGLYDLGKDEVQ